MQAEGPEGSTAVGFLRRRRDSRDVFYLPLFPAQVSFDLSEVRDVRLAGGPHLEVDSTPYLLPGNFQDLAAAVGTNPHVTADPRVDGYDGA